MRCSEEIEILRTRTALVLHNGLHIPHLLINIITIMRSILCIECTNFHNGEAISPTN